MYYYKNLTLKELKYLKRIYSTRLRRITNEITNLKEERTKVNRIGITILTNERYSDNYLKKDIHNLSNKYIENRDWKTSHHHYTNDLLASCVVKEVLEYHNINIDENHIINKYDLNKELFHKLLPKVRNWAISNYWKN